MPSPRSKATSGFLRRLDVRLVLALASIAFVALLVSGIALNQFLPDYFARQAESRLSSAANSTAILIQDTLERLEPAKYSSVSARQSYIQKAAQVAATSLAQGTVAVYYRDDGSLAAVATPEDPSKLMAQGLRLDEDVAQRSEDYNVVLPDLTVPLRIVISDPYTSRAATLDQVRGTLIAAGVIAVIGSLLLGLLAARTLTGPINRLRRVSARFALGELDQRAAPSGVVEIDQLAAQFNVMADRLAESLRLLQADRDRLREFIADVSHELRTPIAALRTFNDLLGNALKFTPRGGVVDVEVTDSPDEAVIEVRDTGPGIPEAELPRIFERFYRGTNVGEARASGSGLGLAIARSIVEMQGGSIEVASAVGRGTSFRARLPRLGEPSLGMLVPPRQLPKALGALPGAGLPRESPAA